MEDMCMFFNCPLGWTERSMKVLSWWKPVGVRRAAGTEIGRRDFIG